MITVDSISKSYPGKSKVLDNVSFALGDSEIVGLLGPNGAGKTTTMRIITGYLTPDSGSVSIDGTNLAENDLQVKSNIGYLPENNPLYKDFLVSEFLTFSAETKGIDSTKLAKEIDFVVTSVKLQDVFYQPIKSLSKGFKQRVGIAAALIGRPKFLILDEPTEGLDPNQRVEIRSLIKTLAKDHTLLISTHIMSEVEAICSKVLVINEGKLVANSSIDDLKNQALGKASLLVDLEGKNAFVSLEKLSGVTVDVIKHENDRVSAKIFYDNKVKIQPELSRIIRQNDLIVWNLSDASTPLEDLFRSLIGKSI